MNPMITIVNPVTVIVTPLHCRWNTRGIITFYINGIRDGNDKVKRGVGINEGGCCKR